MSLFSQRYGTTLSITCDKATYAPGETVNYTIRTIPFCRTMVNVKNPSEIVVEKAVLHRRLRPSWDYSFAIPVDAPLGKWIIEARAVLFLHEVGNGQTTFMVAIAI